MGARRGGGRPRLTIKRGRGCLCEFRGYEMIRYFDIFRSGKWVDQTTDINKAVEWCFMHGCEIKLMEIPRGLK